MAMKPYSILHISDLHRSPRDPISNDELISALVSDRDRYIREDPCVAVPEAIVVSGDIIQGVPLGRADFADEIANQYAVAEQFLDELVRRFLGGDRSRLIMVPGNHDVDWNTARAAFEPVEDADALSGRVASLPDLIADLHMSDLGLRWDWKTRSLYKIADPALYARRLEAFWRFFEKFYQGVPNLLDVKAGADANLFSLCEDRIGVAAFNSCDGNDCFAFHGNIKKDAVGRSYLKLNDTDKFFDLRMAVWHHSISGPPYRNDYMDVDVVHGMIGRAFRIGLYGHQHKTQVAPHEVWLPDRERMAVISAGSLCAGDSELPAGVQRQYNVLEIAKDFRSVRVHVRAMNVANLFSRGHFMDFGGPSFVDLNWIPPRSAVGSAIDTQAQRNRALIEEAEAAARTGDPSQAIAILSAFELKPESYERQLFLMAATDTQDWNALIGATDPPATIDELIQRFEAFCRLGDWAGATSALDQFSITLALPASLEAELRARASAQEIIGQ